MVTGKSARRTTHVFEPHAPEGHRQDQLAPRSSSLDGKVVALLNNTKDLADVLLDEAKNVLQRDFPRAEFRHFRKESVSGASFDLLEQLATCSAVVTAVGD